MVEASVEEVVAEAELADASVGPGDEFAIQRDIPVSPLLKLQIPLRLTARVRIVRRAEVLITGPTSWCNVVIIFTLFASK